jgi:hypothetical protein
VPLDSVATIRTWSTRPSGFVRMCFVRVAFDEMGGGMTDRETDDLFRVRADAVRGKDRELLLSTQVAEIPFAASDGYLALSDIGVDVLHTHDVSDLERIALVKETYHRSGGDERTAFVLYHLTNTVKGWRVFRVQ